MLVRFKSDYVYPNSDQANQNVLYKIREHIPNVSNFSSLRSVSLSLSLLNRWVSLSLRSMSLSQRSMLHSLFHSNKLLSLDESLFLPRPSMGVVVGGCGSGNQLGLIVSRGVGLLIAWFWSQWVLVFWI